MKAIFKTMSVAAAVLMTAGCGNNQGKQTEQAAAVVEELPSVAVKEVFVKEVP
jgi:ABC-type Fe3+-citrate transport system substrate-binding protein